MYRIFSLLAIMSTRNLTSINNFINNSTSLIKETINELKIRKINEKITSSDENPTKIKINSVQHYYDYSNKDLKYDISPLVQQKKTFLNFLH